MEYKINNQELQDKEVKDWWNDDKTKKWHHFTYDSDNPLSHHLVLRQKKVIDYLFQSLNKHRVITSIDPDNKKSIRLVERMGFRKEAHFIESFYMKGKWVDDLIYAMLKKEWKK